MEQVVFLRGRFMLMPLLLLRLTDGVIVKGVCSDGGGGGK